MRHLQKSERIAVAMSGGVDSGMAASILLEAGFDCVGATLHLLGGADPKDGEAEAILDAKAVCEQLGIPHHVLDARAAFDELIVQPFCESYLRGFTPNPCVRCNRVIKLNLLLSFTKRFGCRRIATGHYARIERNSDDMYMLKKGMDSERDQSYFLFELGRDLDKVVFPLGEATKKEMRIRANKLGLHISKKEESQDVCFAKSGDYRAVIAERIGISAKPGPIVDLAGNEMGRHPGVAHFTVGQRRGIGVSSPEPLYVIRLDVRRNTVVVGPESETMSKSMLISDAVWTPSNPPGASFEAAVRVRYRHKETPALVESAAPESWKITFERPVRSIAPGQAAVIYRGDVVLGGGWIREVVDADVQAVA